MYRWLETLEQRHIEFQRYIQYCQFMTHIWTSSANEIGISHSPLESASLQARGLRQAAIFEDLGSLALSKFAEVAHPDFFRLDTDLAELVAVFRKTQLSWMCDLNIARADLVCDLCNSNILSHDLAEFWFEVRWDVLTSCSEEKTEMISMYLTFFIITYFTHDFLLN